MQSLKLIFPAKLDIYIKRAGFFIIYVCCYRSVFCRASFYAIDLFAFFKVQIRALDINSHSIKGRVARILKVVLDIKG